MAERRVCHAIGLVLLAGLVAGCGRATGQEAAIVEGAGVATPTTSTSTTTSSVVGTIAPAPSTTVPTTAAVTAPVAAPASASTAVARPRAVHEQQWTPFATAGGLVLRHPSSRVEIIGFHESNLDGAVPLEPLPTAAHTVTLDGRERDTGSRTAADVVVEPDREIRAPVTGTVRYAETYVLYCQYSDDFLIIEPDDHPGWEVKVLHIDGVQVRPGARVQAGQTVIAPRATQLPFESQVDEVTARPAWPHVHIEVDDPSIPDRPSGGC